MPSLDLRAIISRALAGRSSASLAAEPTHAGGSQLDPDEHPTWDGGWWRGAVRKPAHHGRVGGRCRPWALVVHTTDMHPDTWSGMIRRVQSQPGRGSGAHFWLGRDASQGLVQAVPVDRNANHAGGSSHGWMLADGRRQHPNDVTVGIEVHCAGAVIRGPGSRWYAIDRSDDVDGDGRPDARPTGAPLPDADVEPDPSRPGHGWHRPSEWQFAQLALLLDAFAACPLRVDRPPAWSVEPIGSAQPWAPSVLIGGVPVVGHVTITPSRKGDPWPPLSRWLQGRTGG